MICERHGKVRAIVYLDGSTACIECHRRFERIWYYEVECDFCDHHVPATATTEDHVIVFFALKEID